MFIIAEIDCDDRTFEVVLDFVLVEGVAVDVFAVSEGKDEKDFGERVIEKTTEFATDGFNLF